MPTVSKTARFTVGRGPVPRHPECIENSRRTGSRATVGELRPFCRSRAPALDPIAIRRSQTTEGERGGQAPRYGPERKNAPGTGPRATVSGTAPSVGQDRQILTRWRSGDRKLQRRNARVCPSPAISGDRPSRYGPGRKKCAGDRPPRYGDREIAGDRPPRYDTEHGYFCRFNAPNVVNIRLDGETGPGNNRVTNVSRFPSNATSSI